MNRFLKVALLLVSFSALAQKSDAPLACTGESCQSPTSRVMNSSTCFTSTGRGCSDKLSDVVSVKDFGAKGDGVTDDTAAIQRAVNFASTSIGNVSVCSTNCPPSSGLSAEVYFPTGLYIVTNTITITGMVSLRGDSTELTYTGARIEQTTCGRDLFLAAGEASVGASSLQFINLAMIQKPSCSASFVAGTALIHVPSTIVNAASIYIRDCWFQTPEDFAINAETGDDYVIADNTFDVSARKSMKFGSASKQVTNSIVSRNYFFFVDVGVVDLVNVGRFQFIGNRISGRATRTGYIVDALNTSPVAADSIVIDHNVSLLANGLLLTKFNTANVTGNIARQAATPLVKFGGGGTVGSIVVSSNQLTGVFTGTSAIDGSGASVQFAAIIGNSLTGTDGVGGPTGTGITLTGGSTSNNNLKGNAFFGFATNTNVTGVSNNVESVYVGTGAGAGITSTGGPSGAAGIIANGTSNNQGLIGNGNGSASGVAGVGGATVGAHGVDGTGGSGGGRGVVGTGTTGWEGVVGTGDSGGTGGAFTGGATGIGVTGTGGGTALGGQFTGGVGLAGGTFTNLGTPSAGVLKYCSDCTIANPCASGGAGAIAKRLNGVWVCN